MSEEFVNQAAFVLRFQKAVESNVRYAKSMVRHALPDSWRFFIKPNASYDGNPLVDDETLYPNDSLPTGAPVGPLTFEQALNWLWREGKVPEWVDVSVYAADTVHTYVWLACCGRFSGLEKRLYYRDDVPPFGIKSPDLPAGWESVEASGRFDLPAVAVGRAGDKAT
jgi:hypothetical protein